MVCYVRLLLWYRFLAREAFGLHDRLVQFDFVRIGPAEVDILGQHQPDRVCSLGILKMMCLIWLLGRPG